MQVDNGKKEYNLGREAASRLLKISTRTLDRHIKSKKLSTRVVNGRIWLDKKEIVHFKYIRDVDMSTSKMSTDVDIDNVDIIEQSSVDPLSTLSTLSTRRRDTKKDEEIYRGLYTELKEELAEKQERLEIANYRVGQLESQVKNSVPLLEYHRENFQKKQLEESLKNELAESSNMLKKLYLKIKYEKFSKRIFLIILLIVLALQPLWLIFLKSSG